MIFFKAFFDPFIILVLVGLASTMDIPKELIVSHGVEAMFFCGIIQIMYIIHENKIEKLTKR